MAEPMSQPVLQAAFAAGVRSQGVVLRILVIDDDPAVRRVMEDELVFEGFEVVTAPTGKEGLAAARERHPDLVLLDLKLPDVSGYEICARLRQAGDDVPVIVVSGRDQETDKVRGLALGADDYLTKPFGLAELVARVQAVLRRRRRFDRKERFVLGGLVLDTRRRQALLHGRDLLLTQKEFDILRVLFERQGEVVSRDELLDAVWPGVIVAHRTIDTHIAILRKKLRTPGDDVEYIASVRGVGYKLVDDLFGKEHSVS